VASDPTVSRLIDTLAGDAVHALQAIDPARAAARARVWKLAGPTAPNHHRSAKAPLVVDVDATLITAHSEKQLAAATFKKGFGFHPIGTWVDHGPGGTGEPLAMLLRPGNAGSNTAAGHISVVKAALAQLPASGADRRPGRSVLVRTDGAGGTHEFMDWLTRQRVQYSVGFTMTTDITAQVDALPDAAWTPAYDADGKPRDGAWVAELTGMLELGKWPTGMRVIVRAERPHPGAQLKFTDSNGNRLTAFATNTTGGQLADLELRHRRRARCEDRNRNAKDTGLKNLPSVCPESSLDRGRPTGHRADRLDADARVRRHRGADLGTQEAASRRSASPPGSPVSVAASGSGCPRTRPTATCS
jgi:hypothetical protein